MSAIAVTGGTGFVGQHFIDFVRASGHQIRALTRRPRDERDGVDWIAGDLADRAALEALCEGAEAIVHIAGAISARDRAGFAEANIAGTERVIAAAMAQGVRRFVHISSLAAREPAISLYGWSKAESEARVTASGLDTTIIRPPAVYGPGDRETLELFKMAAKGRIVLPPAERLSLIHVTDLVALILACLDARETIGALYEPDDGAESVLTHEDFGRALGTAVGRNVKIHSMPGWLVRLAARGDRLFRGDDAKLTPDRARYFCHPDWAVDPARKPPPTLWTPHHAMAEGLAETAVWYREKEWL